MLRLSATSKLVFSALRNALPLSRLYLYALFLSLHLRPRDRLNGGINPRYPHMASTSLSLK